MEPAAKKIKVEKVPTPPQTPQGNPTLNKSTTAPAVRGATDLPKVTLAKIPTFLYDQWMETQNGTDLATLTATSQSNSKGQEYSIQLYDPANALTIPKSYILKNYTKTENAMFVMRQPTETGGEIPWRIAGRCEILPVRNKEYMDFLTKRTRDVNTAKRTIKSANLRSDFIRPVAEHPDRIKKVKDKTLDLRNERWPKEQVRDTLFELFAEQPSFSLKELYEKISQPKEWIREVASEICEQRKGEGDVIQKYYLKSEYVVK